MTTISMGQRVGAFVVLVDEGGTRHAVRLSTILAISDADEHKMSSVLQVPGNRRIIVDVGFDEVLRWFA